MDRRRNPHRQSQTETKAQIEIMVKFYASVREMMGINEITFRFHGPPSFLQLMSRVQNSFRFDPFNYSNSQERSMNIMISINNRLIYSDDFPNIQLNDGDVIDIMPLPSGG